MNGKPSWRAKLANPRNRSRFISTLNTALAVAGGCYAINGRNALWTRKYVRLAKTAKPRPKPVALQTYMRALRAKNARRRMVENRKRSSGK